MTETWVRGTLADLAEVNPDKASAVRELESFRYIDISCLSDRGLASVDAVPVVERESAPTRAQRLVRAGDSLVGTVRPERGARGLVREDLDGEVASSGICVLRPRSASDTVFVYSVVRGSSFTAWCVNHSTGTGYPAVAASDIVRFPLLLPSIKERARIAEVLGALDDRIEINHRICQLLASAAQCLAATALGTCSVSDLASTERIQWQPHKSQGQVVDHYSLPSFDAGGEPERVEALTIASNKLQIRAPRVLFSRLNPDTNRTWLYTPSAEVDMSVCSTEYAVLAPTGVSVALLWASLSSGELGSRLASATTGTSASHQRVNVDAVLGSTIQDPRSLDDAERAAVETYVESYLERGRELRLLYKARDFFLPRLVSGELSVAAAEELVEGST